MSNSETSKEKSERLVTANFAPDDFKFITDNAIIRLSATDLTWSEQFEIQSLINKFVQNRKNNGSARLQYSLNFDTEKYKYVKRGHAVEETEKEE